MARCLCRRARLGYTGCPQGQGRRGVSMTRVVLAVALLTNPTMAAAQFNSEQKLVASDGVAGGFFGISVALDGDPRR